MKKLYTALCLIICLSNSLYSQSGADCTNAKPLTMDGVERTYTTSSSTGLSTVCTGYTGTAPITYFSFSTNAAADKVLIEITAPTNDPMEVSLYTWNCGVMYSSGGMCFDDGTGIWSFSHAFSIPASTLFKLRLRTFNTGDIKIKASYYNPANNNCAGAFPISATPLRDNNACHVGGTGVNPADLCASTLENTAFYKYVVATTDVSIINISSISCDNGASNNNNGFQIGFFTGTCATLNPLTCFAGSGNFVTATTPTLTAGTEVVVAIDGVSGANCSYEIAVINGYVLATGIREFTGWKADRVNILKWTTTDEEPANYYEIQRSVNGREFYTIAGVSAKTSAGKDATYDYEDSNPPLHAYYRIKLIEQGSKTTMSRIVELSRGKNQGLRVEMNNPVRNQLNMRVISDISADFRMTIFNSMGQAVRQDMLRCARGINVISENLSSMPAGNYYILLNNERINSVTPFIKLN